MSFKTSIALLPLFFALAIAHVCLLSPTPRGGPVDANKEANPDCGLGEVFGFSAPCGGKPSGAALNLQAGSNFTIVFEKNEDHWYATAPGFFQINFWAENNYLTLAKFADSNTPWDHIYQTTVTLPRYLGRGFLQLIYSTNNPGVKNTNFYHCSDIHLTPFAEESKISKQ
eukprot:TRINITY_DN779_c0_g1_i2.p1 TRINITY_DN779_c0_g1~~TRINITY_DN779_c0_g1_i2.p1  ORF type:complete len:170 (-),score=58.61 TRINITY_DN779_c0_g1_i2:326-835(-)